MSVFSKLKEFKDLREQGKKMQTLLAGESVEAKSYSDKILLTMDGNFQLTALVIDDSVLAPENKEKIQNSIKEAHAEAIKKMQRVIATKMQQSGDFKIPGLNG